MTAGLPTLGDDIAAAAPPRCLLRVTMLGLRGLPDVQGGIESHVQHLAVRLAEMGCDVEVIVRSPYVGGGAARVWRGIRLTRLWAPRRSGAETLFHSLLGVLRASLSRPDILHIHGIGPALFTPLARLLGLRVVVTHHSPNYEHEKWGVLARALLRLGEHLGMNRANGRIAVSAFLAESMRRRYGVPVETIPNGIAVPRVMSSTVALAAFGLRPGRYVLSVARIDPVKRQLDLIAAMERVTGERWRLALVGGADHGTAYARAVAEAAGRVESVVMLGYQTGDALAELFSHAGAFAMVSSHEAQPIAVLEAMSYGRPLILSDIPAHRELAPPCAVFVEPGDVAGLAAHLAALVSGGKSPGGRQAETAAADAIRVATRHDWREIARRTLDVYHEAGAPADTSQQR